jgi:hypothetical protein
MVLHQHRQSSKCWHKKLIELTTTIHMNRNRPLHFVASKGYTAFDPYTNISLSDLFGERTRSYDRGGVPRTNPSSEQSKESVSDDGLLARACCREWHPATGFPMTDTEREAEGQPYNYLFFCIYISSIFLPLPSFPPTLKRIKRSRSTHTHTYNGCNTTFMHPPFGYASFVLECFVPRTATASHGEDCIEQQACWRCCHIDIFSRLHQ